MPLKRALRMVGAASAACAALAACSCTCDGGTDAGSDVGTVSEAGTDAGPVCGNAVAEPGETCDGPDLGGATCETVGGMFNAGALACAPGCADYDTAGCSALPTMPAPRKPAFNAYVGTVFVASSLMLRFSWDPATDPLGRPLDYELSYGVDPTLASPIDTVTTPALGHDVSFLFTATTPPVGARLYWRVRACAGVDCSDYSRTWYFNLGRSDRDFNGDGWADVAVSSPEEGSGGAVRIFLGAAAGPDDIADLTLTGAAADGFGRSLAAVGDANGDGFADLVVGAPGSEAGGTSAGRGYVFFGGATLDAVADGILDGAPGDFSAYGVAGAGDVNGDGYADLAIGAHGNDGGGMSSGAVAVYFGGPGPVFDATADWGVIGAAGDSMGRAVAGAGDLNGDGFEDMVAGAATSDVGGSGAGAAYVFFGGAGPALDTTADGVLLGLPFDRAGSAVAGAGDVNDDGFADLLVGACQNAAVSTSPGRAYVFVGGPGAAFDTMPDAVLSGQAEDDEFGEAVAGAGDVNGDGYADLVVGAFWVGLAYVYLGGPAIDAIPDGVLGTGGFFFGDAVSSAGDVDGDGLSDIVIGEPGRTFMGTAGGAAYVFVGAPGASFDPVADHSLLGTVLGGQMGTAVARARLPWLTEG